MRTRFLCLFKYNFLTETNILKKVFCALFYFCALVIVLFLVTPPENNNNSIIAESAATPNPQASVQQQPEQTVRQQPEKLPDERYKYFGWWGDINYNKAGVFAEPASTSKKLGALTKVNRVKVLEEIKGEMVGENDLWYKIDGGMYPGAYVFSHDVTPVAEPQPPAQPKIPTAVKEGEYWIDVDLTKKVLSLFIYNKPIFATYVATGVYTNPTRMGTYRIMSKFEKTRMRGRPPAAAKVYDLPNVPYVMYYRGSYSIHGTYWHDKFGSRQSSGCTNLTQGDAKFIFDRVNPVIAQGKQLIYSTFDNPGTIIYNHY